MTTNESGSNSLADLLADFAARQPTGAQLAEQARAKEQEAQKARHDFVEFVKSGAINVRDLLQDRKIVGDYFPDNRHSGHDRYCLPGYVLRERTKYGSGSHPRESYLDTDSDWVLTSGHTRKLIISAETGELAISGFNAGDQILGTNVYSGSWLVSESITSFKDGLNLQEQAMADMERTIATYIARS